MVCILKKEEFKVAGGRRPVEPWPFVKHGQWGVERGDMAWNQTPIFYSGGPQSGAHRAIAASA